MPPDGGREMREEMTNAYLPDEATQLAIFRKMALLKINDELTRKTISTGRLMMSFYSYRGQEVIPSALAMNLRDTDYLCTIYRGIHDMLAKGLPLKALWAEIAGRIDGACKGKGGPMHLTYPSKGVMVTTGIVGSSMPIANGLAWGTQLLGRDDVSIATFGDGAANIGAFHEALNLAAVWKLPVIFLCQNNKYSEHTAYDVVTPVARISDRAAAYNMPGVHVDGNDPIAMYAAAAEAVARARAGEGPTLIEAMTFRFNGHVFGDPAGYIPKEELKAAMEADPYPRFRTKLIANGISTEEELAGIEADCTAQINEAIDYALNSPFPGLDELSTDVYGAAA
jgi:pyruvate dehydrogenase E1 component alpha subunit